MALQGKYADAHPPGLRGLLDISENRDRVKDSQLVIHVKTGDRLNSGSDALVTVKLGDTANKWSKEMKLTKIGKNTQERGHTDTFNVLKEDIADLNGSDLDVSKLQLWRNNFGVNASWFVEVVSVENLLTGKLFHFPIHRWIKKDFHYNFVLNDSILPQDDPNQQQRKDELNEQKQMYEYQEKEPGLPVQVKNLPDDEKFGIVYQIDIALDALRYAIIDEKLIGGPIGDHWTSLKDLDKLYQLSMPVPAAYREDNWKDDKWFGQQRLQGCNPVQIRRLTSPHPKIPIDEAAVLPYLGTTLKSAIDEKRVFCVDHEMLDRLPGVPEGRQICAPIALFYLDKDRKNLMPLAIQLNQVAGDGNPVFYPSDEKNVWTLAKMWFNNADANVHQAVTHLGFTHFIMESAAVCANRNFSRSHPLYKLLAPHFLYLQAINALGLSKLVQPNGWMDKTLAIGAKGTFELIGRFTKVWRLDTEATPPRDMAARGVEDPKILPNYPYREDALRIYEAIRVYVFTIVSNFYDSPKKIEGDVELQNFGRELSSPKGSGEGTGFLGVPLTGGKFKTIEEVTTTLAAIICTCSMTHAAVNFIQYDEYAFPPNYPTRMSTPVPTKKTGFTEADIVKAIPTKAVTLDIMAITRLLSSKGTNSLGDFEVQFAYDPVSVAARRQLKYDLEGISIAIAERNANVPKGVVPYPWLDPLIIPNAISI